MAKNKLKKFAALETFKNVFQNFNVQDPKLHGADGNEIDLKGKWNSTHFKNENPLVLELACGHGDYTIELAKLYPNKNFIGVDIKGARIWSGANHALENNMNNVAFLRTRIEQIGLFFENNEIDEIWITFPDPFLRKSRASNRLTSPGFLSRYRTILKSNGIINLKTDSPELYAYTDEVLREDEQVEILYQNPDIYKQPLDFPELEIKTYYEKKHLKINRLITFTQFTIH